MKLTGYPVNKHLEKINQSTNRILHLLADVSTNSTRTLNSYQTSSQIMPLYKKYIKKKVNKLFLDFESRINLSNLQENLPQKHLKRLKTQFKPVSELDDENILTDETSNQALTRKSVSIKSLSPSKSSKIRKNLTPLNKHKLMKDYYYQRVKPHNSFIRRGNKELV